MNNETALTIQPPAPVMHINDIQEIGRIMAGSKMFDMTADQCVALCMIAHAEGRHPALAALDYDIIKGKPALRSKAMLERFQAAGGSVKWTESSDESVTGVFNHPQGGTLEVTWDDDRIKKADLHLKDNHKKYPQQMKRARCISEAVTALFPGAAKFYTPEEVVYFEDRPEPKNITPEVKVTPAETTATKPTTKEAAKGAAKGAAKPAAKASSGAAKIEAARKAAEARKAAMAERSEDADDPPEASDEQDPADAGVAFPPATGEKIPQDTLDLLLTAFEGHGIEAGQLEEWRGLALSKWTDSVLAEMRDLFKAFKAGDMDKDDFLRYLAVCRE